MSSFDRDDGRNDLAFGFLISIAGTVALMVGLVLVARCAVPKVPRRPLPPPPLPVGKTIQDWQADWSAAKLKGLQASINGDTNAAREFERQADMLRPLVFHSAVVAPPAIPKPMSFACDFAPYGNQFHVPLLAFAEFSTNLVTWLPLGQPVSYPTNGGTLTATLSNQAKAFVRFGWRFQNPR